MRAKFGEWRMSVLRMMSPLARFYEKVERTATCWVWMGARSQSGYGQHHRAVDGVVRSCRAHRFVYELAIGPIPSDRQIDHICRNRACVRLDHLRLATPSQNSRYRQSTFDKLQRLKDGVCINGHDLRIHWNEKYQRCWECNRIHSRINAKKARDRRKAAC